MTCRTAALGGHLYVCDTCGHELPLYNSCRNRHCPACQALDQERWIRKREERLLPVGHHHVVFTLPSELRALARRHPKELHSLLFKAASDVLSELASTRWGARLGLTAVLHTWTRELTFHPHLHCIVTAGGLSLDGERWIDQSRYLFPVRQLRRAYSTKVIEQLRHARAQGTLSLPEDGATPDSQAWQAFLQSLPKWRRWVLHVEAPFGRSTHVLRYLGRYTHRVAISDARIVAIDECTITFRTRDENRMTLAAEEFIRRFLLHILPRGFHKIRHFGLYASQPQRRERAAALLGAGDTDVVELESADVDLDTGELLAELTGKDPRACPACGEGRLVAVLTLPRAPRAPP